jgi:AcrR family transcriptional regulator
MSLIRAAERLFADRGFETVSLREITRAAGQRNTNALQYHFASRDGLLREVLGRHTRDVSTRRNALLDQYEMVGQSDLRLLVSALVLPLVAKLDDPDGGPAFLQIAAELLSRMTRPAEGDDPVLIVLRDPENSLQRWLDLVAPMMPQEAVGAPLHRRFAAVRLTHAELSRRAKDGPRPDHVLFTHQLTDVVVALLVAPVSDETKRALDQHRRS